MQRTRQSRRARLDETNNTRHFCTVLFSFFSKPPPPFCGCTILLPGVPPHKKLGGGRIGFCQDITFRLGGRPTRTWGAASQPYSCDHGSHGRLWCACFSSKGALCVRCMAEIGPCRELPPSPDAPGGGPRCTSRSVATVAE